MKRITVILISLLFAICSLVGCYSKSEPNSGKLTNPEKEDKEYSFGRLKDTSDCLILLEMLHKECVRLNARLGVPTLKQIFILVPLNKYVLDCDQFTFNNIPVIVSHQVVKIDSLRNNKPQKDEPIRTFFLIDYKRGSNYKRIELLYTPSGSIFKIVVKIDQDKAVIDDFFCAKY